jgi:hypothetical protein
VRALSHTTLTDIEETSSFVCTPADTTVGGDVRRNASNPNIVINHGRDECQSVDGEEVGLTVERAEVGTLSPYLIVPSERSA